MTKEVKEAKQAYKKELRTPVSHRLNRNTLVIEPILRFSNSRHCLLSNGKLIIT